MNIQSNDFELFALPPSFAQSPERLDARWKDLQRQAHPDKFAADGATAQRLAMQWSVRINEAYQRLRDPVKRGAYLCELAACPVQAHDNTAMPGDFLLQQMQWREALEEASDIDALEQLRTQVKTVEQHYLQRMAHALDVDGQPQQAVACVRALMFIERFARDVDHQLDELEE